MTAIDMLIMATLAAGAVHGFRKGIIDRLSISLNSPDAKEYLELWIEIMLSWL